jgi:CubicO group peptidase (beta-lactamase class C family)
VKGGLLLGCALLCAIVLALPARADQPPAGAARAAAGTAQDAGGVSTASLVHQIKDYLAGEMLADSFSGVVVLSRNGETIFSGVYGSASKEYGTPNALDTRFNLGSINKLMTRIAVMQLVEQGKLSYGDTIGAVLPEYPNKQAAAQVTVGELLDMSSGIGDFFGAQYMAMSKDRLRSLHDYLPLFASKPLAFTPGTKHQYSNGGFIVLGLMIERRTGLSYYDYVKTNIFAPAGMTASGWFERDSTARDIATGYTKDGADGPHTTWCNNVYTAPERGSSAGGGYSTAPDLLKFAAALQDGKLLNTRDTAAVLQGGIGVAGGAPGINADMEIDPASGYTLVVLSNYDPPSAERVAATIRGYIGLE